MEKGREPTITEISQILEVDVTLATEAINSSIAPISLTLDDDTGENGQLDIPVSGPQEKIDEKLSINQLLDDLEGEDKMLVKLRFFKKYTQTQTAKVLNTTQVQISRREKAILIRLRKKLVIS
jgi:RNA polymerase sporulation-specific sigma factor